MLHEIARIDRPNITSFGEAASRRICQQSVREKLKAGSIEGVVEARRQGLRPSDRAESEGGKYLGETKKENESLSKAPRTESASVETPSSGRKVTIPQQPKEPGRSLAVETVSKTPAPSSSHNRPTSKLAHHGVSLNKKISKQIWTIQRAINQESRRGSYKTNSGILNGLYQSLRKLNAARIRLDKSLSSNSHKKQDKIRSPASQAHLTSGEPIQRAASPESRSPPQRELGEKQALLSAISTFEEPFPSLVVPVSQEMYTRPQLIEAAVSTTEKENTMADRAIANWLNRREKRRSASVDNDMTDVHTNEDKFFPLTKDCHHYTRRADVDWDIQKYWDQRYSIFSLYDKGIHLTDDSWFGVTPEPVANKVAEDLAVLTLQSKDVLIDMFAGGGGNVIAFALSKRWSTIIAIEKDPSVIACAQHNATIYGVNEQIIWINDDSFSYLASKSSSIDPSKTVIFASPPWGGPGYSTDKVFNLNTMSPYSIKQIHDVCKGMDSALYLPRSSDLRQIAKLAPGGMKVEVVQYCMQGASKALVAYIPAAARSNS